MRLGRAPVLFVSSPYIAVRHIKIKGVKGSASIHLERFNLVLSSNGVYFFADRKPRSVALPHTTSYLSRSAVPPLNQPSDGLLGGQESVLDIAQVQQPNLLKIRNKGGGLKRKNSQIELHVVGGVNELVEKSLLHYCRYTHSPIISRRGRLV
jgi:hypothetical protein